MAVYFVQAENGMIKIGMSINPEERLKGLKTGSPILLELIKVVNCNREKSRLLEYELHLKFGGCRLHGEWFQPTKELLKYIKSLPELKFVKKRSKIKKSFSWIGFNNL